jgi:hypothetical protein
VVQCGTVWYSVVQCGTVWYSVVQCGTVQQYNQVLILHCNYKIYKMSNKIEK